MDAEQEEESIDLPFTLTQASSLYILTINGEEFFKRKVEELSNRLKREEDEEQKQELIDGLAIINQVLDDTIHLKKEAKMIIQELDIEDKPTGKKPMIITDIKKP